MTQEKANYIAGFALYVLKEFCEKRKGDDIVCENNPIHNGYPFYVFQLGIENTEVTPDMIAQGLQNALKKMGIDDGTAEHNNKMSKPFYQIVVPADKHALFMSHTFYNDEYCDIDLDSETFSFIYLGASGQQHNASMPLFIVDCSQADVVFSQNHNITNHI